MESPKSDEKSRKLALHAGSKIGGKRLFRDDHPDMGISVSSWTSTFARKKISGTGGGDGVARGGDGGGGDGSVDDEP